MCFPVLPHSDTTPGVFPIISPFFYVFAPTPKSGTVRKVPEATGHPQAALDPAYH